MVGQHVYPLSFNPNLTLLYALCDLGLRDYTLNFPKSLARWFSLDMNQWEAPVGDCKEGKEEKILFWLPALPAFL